MANHEGVQNREIATDGPNCKALARFGTVAEVNLQVGISYVSVANARTSVERQAAGKSFDQVRQEAAATWEEALARIRVSGGTDDQKRIFYTLFTRLICQPSDLGVDDDFHLWKSGVRHFTDFICVWDSVRNANSLITLFDPAQEVAMLNCLLDVGAHTGWIADAWFSGHSARIQGGSSADILLCEAALKGLQGIDYEKALRQMRKNNETESPDTWRYGRFLPEYRDLGYLSTNVPESVSRHLDEFFDRGFYWSKETMLHIPYLYIYAGSPARTAQRVRECLAKFFRATRDGLSDGEDMGCQSAFYMCSTMGFYPIMGQDLYLLSSPLFTRTEMDLPASGRTLVIEAPDAGPAAPYVQSATLNGKPLARAWVRHHEIISGGVLRFELGARPSAWGTRDLPRT